MAFLIMPSALITRRCFFVLVLRLFGVFLMLACLLILNGVNILLIIFLCISVNSTTIRANSLRSFLSAFIRPWKHPRMLKEPDWATFLYEERFTCY